MEGWWYRRVRIRAEVEWVSYGSHRGYVFDKHSQIEGGVGQVGSRRRVLVLVITS